MFWPPPVLPPHRYSVQGQLIADAGRRLGQLPFPTPLAINSVPYRGRPACRCEGPCNEHLCRTGTRADARSPFTGVALARDALTIAFGSKAVRIDLGNVSRADSVEWVDTLNRQRAGVRARAAWSSPATQCSLPPSCYGRRNGQRPTASATHPAWSAVASRLISAATCPVAPLALAGETLANQTTIPRRCAVSHPIRSAVAFGWMVCRDESSEFPDGRYVAGNAARRPARTKTSQENRSGVILKSDGVARHRTARPLHGILYGQSDGARVRLLAAWRTRFLISRSSDACETYLWVSRWQDGISVNFRYPGAAVARTAMDDYLAEVAAQAHLISGTRPLPRFSTD
ncbi:hypothetical protein ACVWW1_008976 [Bradyrhizobium sp. JR3.5]